MDLNTAIEKHAEWKTKFRSAIAKQEKMDDATISKDNCCELGKWLHTEAKIKYSRFQSHANCIDKHATFHIEAGKVAKTINAGKYNEAEAMLATGKSYANASNEVGVAIIKLKKEAGL